MPLGRDQQYDLSWTEQDKIRRRLEIKNRLKVEGVRKRYDPYLMLEKVILTDPAVDRYSDLRKKGRMPNVPFKPKLFFTLVGTIFIPVGLLAWGIRVERDPWLEKVASGEIGYEDRTGRSVT